MEKNQLNLVIRAQSGDADSFGALYDLYADKIYKYIYYRTNHKETAEDITSLSFIKALENLASFRPEKGSFSSWLYRIAHNSVIDYYRGEKPSAVLLDETLPLADGKDIESDIDKDYLAGEAKKYLDSLSQTQREIVIMRVWDELSYKEIAEIIGKSEENCKVIFSRAIASLRGRVSLALYLILLLSI